MCCAPWRPDESANFGSSPRGAGAHNVRMDMNVTSHSDSHAVDAADSFAEYLRDFEAEGPMLNFGSFIGHSLQAQTGAGLHVDQAGAAWTMCVNAQGASVTRYTLQDSAGQPLPEASPPTSGLE